MLTCQADAAPHVPRIPGNVVTGDRCLPSVTAGERARNRVAVALPALQAYEARLGPQTKVRVRCLPTHAESISGQSRVAWRGAHTHAVTSSPAAGSPTAPAGQTLGSLVIARHLTRVIGSAANGQRIIDDVSFSVPQSSLFAINGPSGSGKTTLLNLMTGIDHPTTGEITVGGDSLAASSENALARWRGRHVGIIFQFFHLIQTLTAFENVLLALELGGGGGLPRAQWRDWARACLASVEMASYHRRLPSELSGGQQQRVAIARAIANDPPLIVADEPTGNLDSKTAASVFELLEHLTAAGKTVVYVTHDRDLASRAAASIKLFDGRVTGRRERQDHAGLAP
jgi:putative ABC transport system ATP-binding protein